MKKCPFCAEEIQDAAIKCRYCGSALDQPVTLAAPASQSTTVPGMPRDEFEGARELARQGHKINAIKLVRDKTGWGLKEAKDFVESPAFGVPAAAHTPAPAGAAGTLLLIMIVVGGGIWWLSNPSPPRSAPSLTRATTTPPPTPTPATAPSAQPAPPAPTRSAAQDTARAESARAGVAKMVSLDLIKRMDLKTGKIYINGPLWEGFELNGKENIVKVISGYRDAEYGLPQVTLYESRSGKELAGYGAFGGVTIR